MTNEDRLPPEVVMCPYSDFFPKEKNYENDEKFPVFIPNYNNLMEPKMELISYVRRLSVYLSKSVISNGSSFSINGHWPNKILEKIQYVRCI